MTRERTQRPQPSSQSDSANVSDVAQRRAIAPTSGSETEFTQETPVNSFHKPRFTANFSQVSARTVGQPLIQAKLAIGPVNDKYEQEADRVAKQIVQQISFSGGGQSQPGQTVQRKIMPEEELQMKPLVDQIQRKNAPQEEDELQMKPNSLQQEAALKIDDELKTKPIVQPQSDRSAIAATAKLENAIQRSYGSGQPLAGSIRQPMEHAFGNVDFSEVKVHTDTQSDQLNRSIQAKAFTTGQDVFFRQGAYQPESRGGQELIAHELTHVVQQTGGEIKQFLQTTEFSPPSALVGDRVHHAKNSTVIQRTWEKSSDDPNLQVWDDYQSFGFVWYYNSATKMMFYKTLVNLGRTVKDKAHRDALKNYEGTPHTYEQWLEYGWGRQGQEQPEPPTPVRDEPKTPKDYSGVTAGVEQEISGSCNVKTKARGRLGKVIRIDNTQETLIEFETDMASKLEKDIYTLEFKTTPCSLDDTEGLQLRSEAQKFLVAQIRTAVEGKEGRLENANSGSVQLKVDRSNFTIVKPPPGKNMTFGNQATIGVKTTDLLGAAKQATTIKKPDSTSIKIKNEEESARGDQAAALILTVADWFHYPFSKPLMDAFELANKDNAAPGREDAAACYNLITQLIMFMSNEMMEIAKKAEKQVQQEANQAPAQGEAARKTEEELGQTVINDEGYPILDTSLPVYKNKFRTLPKTSPMQWLKALPQEWQAIVRQAVGTPPSQNKAPKNVYASVWKFIQDGQALAGHPIPLFTIQGNPAAAFEFRSFPSMDKTLKKLKYE